MNVITFVGRLGKDSDLRYTQDGTSILGFTAASDVGFGNNKKTNWFKCTVWGKRAEAIHPYLKKGVEVTVIGEFSTDEYEKEGVKHSTNAVRVNEIKWHTHKVDNTEWQQTPQGSKPAFKQREEFVEDSSIPF